MIGAKVAAPRIRSRLPFNDARKQSPYRYGARSNHRREHSHMASTFVLLIGSYHLGFSSVLMTPEVFDKDL